MSPMRRFCGARMCNAHSLLYAKKTKEKNQMMEKGNLIQGKYEVLELLGQGGMSSVYLVLDLKLEKKWAAKEIVIPQNGREEHIYMESAMTEINIMKRLDHPALPRIVDVAEKWNCIYVIMDYIEGESLETILKKGASLETEKVLKWAKELCEVLEYLHRQEPPIIYRDMKPSNIMVSHNGNIKLIDFGSVREYKEQSRKDTVCLGTRGYAAPEQFGGKGQTDIRTDIYSLGMTLYHLLTGEEPWENAAELLLEGVGQTKLTDGWKYILKKCIWRNPNLRYQSCSELLRDLNHYEKLNKKYQKKSKRREGIIKGVGKVIKFIIIFVIFLVITRDTELGFILKEKMTEYFDKIKKAEKPECLSAFKDILDFSLQKIYHFFNLQRGSLNFLGF